MKTRFCPSPTGHMHLGNLRTALFNVLLARSVQGRWILRIEDTDLTRSKQTYTESIIDDLIFLDLLWQEGPDQKGTAGPYFQSQRQSIYDHYYRCLEEAGRAYLCFCVDSQLALNRKIQAKLGKPPRYPGTCRHLSEQDIRRRIDEGQTATLRFTFSPGQVIEFDDLVKGRQTFMGDDMGDFIIRRADGSASFMYANAIDDALMGVTHALRGEDHLANTPRQLAILNALQLPEPKYGHISLILGQDGLPLSKRNGSRSIKDLRAEGFMPAAILNYLARLGHYECSEDLLSLDQLSGQFSLSALSRSPTRFDFQQLVFWQKKAVMQSDADAFWSWLTPDTRAWVPESKKLPFIELMRVNVVYPEEAEDWAKILFLEPEPSDFCQDAHHAILLAAGAAFFQVALAHSDLACSQFKSWCQAIQSDCQVKGQALYLPLRLALTGRMHGPELPTLLVLMGLEKTKCRLKKAFKAFEAC